MTEHLPAELTERFGSAVLWQILRQLALRCHASTQFRVRSMSESPYVTIHVPDASTEHGLRRAGFFGMGGGLVLEEPGAENTARGPSPLEACLLGRPPETCAEEVAHRLRLSLSSAPQMSPTVLAIGLLADVTWMASLRGPGFFPRCGWRDASPVWSDVDQPAPWLKSWVKMAKRYEAADAMRADRYWLLDTPRPCVIDFARARAWLSPTSKDAEDLWARSDQGRDPAAASAWLLRKTGLLDPGTPLKGTQVALDFA